MICGLGDWLAREVLECTFAMLRSKLWSTLLGAHQSCFKGHPQKTIHPGSLELFLRIILRIILQSAEIVANSPSEALKMVKADIVKWAEVAKKSGAKID